MRLPEVLFLHTSPLLWPGRRFEVGLKLDDLDWRTPQQCVNATLTLRLNRHVTWVVEGRHWNILPRLHAAATFRHVFRALPPAFPAMPIKLSHMALALYTFWEVSLIAANSEARFVLRYDDQLRVVVERRQ